MLRAEYSQAIECTVLCQIYQLVCEYDLTLMEDDPYYYLCYGHAKAPASPQEFTRLVYTEVYRQ